MHTLVVGQGGIGAAVATQAVRRGDQVTVVTRQNPGIPQAHSCLTVNDWSWEALTSVLTDLDPRPDQVVVALGQLWTPDRPPEKRIEDLSADGLMASVSANTLAPMAVIQALTTRMNRADSLKALIITAKVASITDNRLGGWYGYRASKAATHMLIKTTAIEWQRRFPDSALCAYHPGTTDSELSRPFQKRVPEHQLKSAEEAAQCLWQVMDDQVSPANSGRFWSWDGTELPW